MNNNYINCPICKNIFLKTHIKIHFQICKKKTGSNIDFTSIFVQKKDNNNLRRPLNENKQNLYARQHINKEVIPEQRNIKENKMNLSEHSHTDRNSKENKMCFRNRIKHQI